MIARFAFGFAIYLLLIVDTFASLHHCRDAISAAIIENEGFDCEGVEYKLDDGMWRASSRQAALLGTSKAEAKEVQKLLGKEHVNFGKAGFGKWNLEISAGAMVFVACDFHKMLQSTLQWDSTTFLAIGSEQLAMVHARASEYFSATTLPYRRLIELLVKRSRVVERFPDKEPTGVEEPMLTIDITSSTGSDSFNINPSEDIQTISATACRRNKVTAGECGKLEDFISGKIDEWRSADPERRKQVGELQPRRSVLATISSPLKSETISSGVRPLIEIELTNGRPAHCCIYVDDSEASIWCGAVNDHDSGVVGALPRPDADPSQDPAVRHYHRNEGPTHIVHLICRASLEKLQEDVSSFSTLIPDDSSFFTFEG